MVLRKQCHQYISSEFTIYTMVTLTPLDRKGFQPQNTIFSHGHSQWIFISDQQMPPQRLLCYCDRWIMKLIFIYVSHQEGFDSRSFFIEGIWGTAHTSLMPCAGAPRITRCNVVAFAMSPSTKTGDLAGHRLTRPWGLMQCESISFIVGLPGKNARYPVAKPEQQINADGLTPI